MSVHLVTIANHVPRSARAIIAAHISSTEHGEIKKKSTECCPWPPPSQAECPWQCLHVRTAVSAVAGRKHELKLLLLLFFLRAQVISVTACAPVAYRIESYPGTMVVIISAGGGMIWHDVGHRAPQTCRFTPPNTDTRVGPAPMRCRRVAWPPTA